MVNYVWSIMLHDSKHVPSDNAKSPCPTDQGAGDSIAIPATFPRNGIAFHLKPIIALDGSSGPKCVQPMQPPDHQCLGSHGSRKSMQHLTTQSGLRQGSVVPVEVVVVGEVLPLRAVTA